MQLFEADEDFSPLFRDNDMPSTMDHCALLRNVPLRKVPDLSLSRLRESSVPRTITSEELPEAVEYIGKDDVVPLEGVDSL